MLPLAKAVAQTAGRVVMAVGDVTVQRANGNTATNLPASGQVNYNPVGGTSPTMSMNGQSGTLVSGGQVSIDFGQATAS